MNKSDQSKKTQKKVKDDSNRNSISSSITFNTPVFFEFFLYHFLYYFCFGPLMSPFLYIFRGKHINSNLSFISLDKYFFHQLFNFISTISLLFIYIYFKPSYFYLIEIYMVVSAAFLKICIISIKYATMDPIKLQEVYDIRLNSKMIYNELTLGEWAEQTDQISNTELLRLLKKNKEEIPFFKINFMSNPPKEIEEEFSGKKKIEK